VGCFDQNAISLFLAMILILTDYHFPLRETTKFPHWEILVSVVVPLSFLTPG
jgi:hypothetical protein